MNGYIIDPAWFYWIAIADAIRTTMFIIAAILLVFGGVVGIFVTIGNDVSDVIDVDVKAVLKMIIAGAVCFVIAVLIPSKETLIAMQVAKYATWENANWTVDAVKEAVDYIVNALGSME